MSIPQREAVSRAVGFLAANQLPYGEFRSYRYTDRYLTSAGEFDSSPFATCLIVYSLGFVENATAAGMIDKAMSFLLDEWEAPGVWRYWTSHNSSRIDPDLDDTSCASFLIKRYAPQYSTKSNEALIIANRTDDGLFKTWLRGPQDKNDVDSVVNSNVLLYLGERDETRAACRFLNRIIEQSSEEGTYWYYLDHLALYYMVSRAYFNGVNALGGSRQTVIKKVQARQSEDGSFGDELLTGLALCTFLNYGISDDFVRRGIRYLIQTQQPSGSWRSRLFYAGPEPPTPHSVWWGGEEFTTAFCLEALARSNV